MGNEGHEEPIKIGPGNELKGTASYDTARDEMLLMSSEYCIAL